MEFSQALRKAADYLGHKKTSEVVLRPKPRVAPRITALGRGQTERCPLSTQLQCHQTRNLLLPKLISGAIDVSEMETET